MIWWQIQLTIWGRTNLTAWRRSQYGCSIAHRLQTPTAHNMNTQIIDCDTEDIHSSAHSFKTLRTGIVYITNMAGQLQFRYPSPVHMQLGTHTAHTIWERTNSTAWRRWQYGDTTYSQKTVTIWIPLSGDGYSLTRAAPQCVPHLRDLCAVLSYSEVLVFKVQSESADEWKQKFS